MPGTMSQSDLVSDLQLVMNDSAKSFKNARQSMERHLLTAAARLSEIRPQRLDGELNAVADQALYVAPANILAVSYVGWGDALRRRHKPWDRSYPEAPPVAQVVDGASGRQIRLTPAPTAGQIAALGAGISYCYTASHTIGALAVDTTVRTTDRELLLLAAVIAALRELALRGVDKPVQLGPGTGSQARNGTPAGLLEAWQKEWDWRAAR